MSSEYVIWRMDHQGVSRFKGRARSKDLARYMVEEYAGARGYAYAILWSPDPSYAFGSLDGETLTNSDLRKVLRQFTQTHA